MATWLLNDWSKPLINRDQKSQKSRSLGQLLLSLTRLRITLSTFILQYFTALHCGTTYPWFDKYTYDQERGLEMSANRKVRWATVAIIMIALAGYRIWDLDAPGLSAVHYRHGMETTGDRLPETSQPLAKESRTPQAMHSTIICQMDETNSDSDRRCHLENVCWDRRESTFVYFLDPARPDIMPATTLPNGRPRRISVKRTPPDFTDGAEFLPLVERAGPIPLEKAIFSNHNVHLYFTSFWAENFGHALVDDIHSLFALMHAFKMTTRDSVFLYPRDVADNIWHAGWRERASKFLFELASMISDNGILRMDTHADFSWVPSNHSGPHLMCMEHLLVGSGNLENLNTPPHVNIVGSWPGFIEAILTDWRRKFSPETGTLVSIPIKEQLLVFIRKVGRRGFLNLEALVEQARLRFGMETMVINPGEMSIMEQIAVAQRATVTFSPPGGISFFNAFLREGAVAIVADIWHLYENASFPLEGYFWDRISTEHRTLRYHVQEHELVIQPPGNPTAKTWWDYRDNAATMLDIERATRLIDHALYTSQHVFHICKDDECG